MYIFLNVFLVLLSTTIVVLANEYAKVIVIGAGPAGIAAATKLLENGVDSVVILEAENRIGGRVNTVYLQGRPSELGAEWCHGKDGNTVYEIAKQYNLLTEEDYYVDMLYSDGETFDEEIATDVYDLLINFDTYEVPDEYKEVSLGQWVLKHYDEKILEKYKNDRRKLKMAVEAIPTLESVILTNEGAFSWFDRSLDTNFEESNVSIDLLWNGVGYDTILNVMMKTYKSDTDVLRMRDKIHLNKTVVRIEWLNDDSSAVTVTCQDGSKFTGDHVIFTPSLGVLKQRHEKLFRPVLPHRKRDAIKKLGFEGVMKILVYFPERWWPEDFNTTFLIWTAEDKINIPHELDEGPVKNGESWVTHVSVVDMNKNNPNVLIAWLTGDIIKEVEQTDLTVIQNGVMHIFEKFFGDLYNITEPETIIHSSWCTNPHFLGTYSFETVESRQTEECNHALSEPLSNYSGVPVLLFAGEATSVNHFSTVHGAIESGYREASRLLTLFKKTSDKIVTI